MIDDEGEMKGSKWVLDGWWWLLVWIRIMGTESCPGPGSLLLVPSDFKNFPSSLDPTTYKYRILICTHMYMYKTVSISLLS